MSSQIRAARINLMKLWADAMPDDTFFWYGKRLGMFSAPLTVQIYGWTATQTPAELSPEYRVEETFDISCCVSSFYGNQDFDAREQEATDAFKILAQTVATNYTLGYPAGTTGPIRWAYVTDYEFIPDVTATQGQSVGTLDFKIQGQQRIETQS